MNHNFTGWIDIPVVDAIDYFSGLLGTFFYWASRYAQVIGLIGLCWAAFKLINSRFTLKDFWWDIFYKWLAFVLLMSLYIPVTTGIAVLGNKVGTNAGGGKYRIIQALTEMRTAIEADLETEQKWENELAAELKSRFDNLELPSVSEEESYSSYIKSVRDAVTAAEFSSKEQKKEAKALINEYKNKSSDQSIYGARTLKALNNILIERNLYDEQGNLIDSYITLDIWLKGSSGNDSYYISPAALLRLAGLSCQILWEQNQLVLSSKIDDIESSKDIGLVEKPFTKLNASFSQFPSLIMTMLCCAGIIVCVVFSDIQYLMCILEYTIVTSIGAFFIPFILFDGTKDLPKKLVPVFLGFFMKFIVMNIIIMFIFNALITNTVMIITDDAGMNWITFAGHVFFIFLAFILSSNGPKIAQTIVSGQPQLSMGEAVQMAGSLYGAATLGNRARKAVREKGKDVAREVALRSVDATGATSKAFAAGHAAAKAVKESGGSKSDSNKAAISGMFASATGDLKEKILNMGNSFMHESGGKKGNGMGGSGNGSPAHERSGQINMNMKDGESRTLSNQSNPHFQTATRFDKLTNSNVNMTTSEYMNEKKGQGQNIGKEAAENYLKKHPVVNPPNDLPEENFDDNNILFD